MLSENIVKLLNQQINREYFSSNLYLQMSAWCEWKGLPGSAFFLRAHAGEELAHGTKLFTYVHETGALPLIGALAAPPADYGSLVEIFEKTYAQEQATTRNINEPVGAALAEKDFSTFQFLQWYVAEQHEEEKLFRSIRDKAALIGGEGRSLYYLDKEIRKFAPAVGG
jgi:ferritin